jgi:hypothetical protein
VRILSLDDGTQLRAVATQAVNVSSARMHYCAQQGGEALASGMAVGGLIVCGGCDPRVSVHTLPLPLPSLLNPTNLPAQAVPESLLMLHGVAADEPGSGDAGLFLHVGLSNGVLQRTEVDRITGGRAGGWVTCAALQNVCLHNEGGGARKSLVRHPTHPAHPPHRPHPPPPPPPKPNHTTPQASSPTRVSASWARAPRA